MSTLFLDPDLGSDANDGTSFANRFKTWTTGATAARTAPADVVRVKKSPDSTLVGSATWTNKSSVVSLFSTVATIIVPQASVFTANANVTTSTTTPGRAGTLSSSIAVGAAFTTGVAAFYNTGVVDLSAYQQVCFWIRPDVAIAANSVRLSLCNAVSGATPINDATITEAIQAGQWFPVVVDFGTALHTTVRSVAINILVDFGAVTLLIDNVFAAKASSSADSVTLRSLIGKNTAGETFWSVRAMGASGSSLLLDNNPQSPFTTTPRGYSGVSETVSTYKRECFAYPTVSGNTTPVNAVQESGSSGAVIEYSGGWDTTAMTSQTGETWIDGRTGVGYGLDFTLKNFIKLSKLNFVRYYENCRVSGTDAEIADGSFNNGNFYGINNLSTAPRLTLSGSVFGVANGVSGLNIGGASPSITGTCISNSNESSNGLQIASTIADYVNAGAATIKSNNNVGQGLNINTAGFFGTVTTSDNSIGGVAVTGSVKRRVEIKSLTCLSNGSLGVSLSCNTSGRVLSYTSSGNTTASISVTGFNEADWTFEEASMAEATKVTAIPSYTNFRVTFPKLGSVLTSNETFLDGCSIKSNTTDRNTASGVSWELNPLSTNRQDNYPVTLSVCKRAVKAGFLATFSGAAKRNNAGITSRFRILGGRVAGVNSDIVIPVTNVGTWNTYGTTFTPTEDGTIEVIYEAYGGTTFQALVDDVDITQ